MDPCAGLHILAHGSIPLPYLPNLCAVLRPAPLASYYFPFLSFPLLSPCIGLSLDCDELNVKGEGNRTTRAKPPPNLLSHWQHSQMPQAIFET